jgi:hypothetical protein
MAIGPAQLQRDERAFLVATPAIPAMSAMTGHIRDRPPLSVVSEVGPSVAERSPFKAPACSRSLCAITARRESGAKENRTPDLFHAMEALYQLSYSPVRITNCTGRERVHKIAGPTQIARGVPGVCGRAWSAFAPVSPTIRPHG